MLLGATGAFLWLGGLAVVLSVGGFVAMILLYASMHSPPHSRSGAHGGDAGTWDAAGD